MRFEYLIFNIIIISAPILIPMLCPQYTLPRFSSAVMSSIIAALPFFIWDYLATGTFWSFNNTYILNVFVGRLPVEEILFFFAVPYTSLFIWVNLKDRVASKNIMNDISMIFLIIFIVGICAYAVKRTWHYTAIDLFYFAGMISVDRLLGTNIMRVSTSYVYFIIVAMLTLIFDFYLTALPIVTYNPTWKTNINITTVPFEDILFGITLAALTAVIYEWITSRQASA